jgi:hypothetical protein
METAPPHEVNDSEPVANRVRTGYHGGISVNWLESPRPVFNRGASGPCLNSSLEVLHQELGSLVLRYNARAMRNLYAAVMVYDTGHPIDFHMDAFAQATEFDAGSREGIWWLPGDSVTGYLILTNVGDRNLAPSLVL